MKCLKAQELKRIGLVPCKSTSTMPNYKLQGKSGTTKANIVYENTTWVGNKITNVYAHANAKKYKYGLIIIIV